MADLLTSQQLQRELVFTTSRSSGAGGQNVNKVNTKVTLRWDVAQSTVATAEQIELLLKKLATRITTEGVLVLTAQESRSQLQNKEEVLNKLDQMLQVAFRPVKIRKASKPGISDRKKRIENKRRQSEKKLWRKKL